MRDYFQEQMKKLHQEMTEMGRCCEEIIELASHSLTGYSRELEQQVAVVGAKIDESEHTVENLCLNLLLRQQPVAGDLRQVSAAMKMITDLERIGDQAEDIVDLVPKMRGAAEEDYAPIRQMAIAAQTMVAEAVDAYTRQDVDLARAVMARDDVVDAFFCRIKSDIVSLLRQRGEEGEYAVDLLMIAKYFERIADHCTNVAEWVVFSVTGEHRDCQ